MLLLFYKLSRVFKETVGFAVNVNHLDVADVQLWFWNRVEYLEKKNPEYLLVTMLHSRQIYICMRSFIYAAYPFLK